MSGYTDDSQSEAGDVDTQSQMFTLRIWVINREGVNIKWRGRIQHIQSGEVQYCQNWDTFIAYVEKMLCSPSDI